MCVSSSVWMLELIATVFQSFIESSGIRTASIDSLFVRTRRPRRSLIFGSEPRCLHRANSSLVPSAPAETITFFAVSARLPPPNKPGEPACTR